MHFQRISPDPALGRLIECYWVAEDTDVKPTSKKIIPDGFTEIIFHFGDPYRIRLQDRWEVQSMNLVAGQISRHFFLENTGKSSILGIKMKPTALARLYPQSMHDVTDRVVDLNFSPSRELMGKQRELRERPDHRQRIDLLNGYFKALLAEKGDELTPADRAVDVILEQHGMMPVTTISESVGLGERQLENLFRRYVGLSPKLFARIIRFNYIFELVQQNEQSWCDLAYEAAYYDQSHFIRNFRNFTGENPADYAFDEKNLANFFLNRK